MRIGLDLDNTIINYDCAFIVAAKAFGLSLPDDVKNKIALYEFLNHEGRGHIIWQKIQGQVYSRFISTHACLFPGVKRFLLHSQLLGNEVFIVSHKTENGHFDKEKLPIRKIALDFLEDNGLIGGQFPLVSGVYFGSSRKEKIEKIVNLNLDWFVDDLHEVILDLQSAELLNKVFFNSSHHNCLLMGSNLMTHEASDWLQIDLLINGGWSKSQIQALCFKVLGEPIQSVENILSGRNAGVYRLSRAKGPSLRIKLYPPDSNHDRLHSESLACSVINKYHSDLVPPVLRVDESLELAVYEWLEGEPISDHGLHEIDLCINFLKTINSLRGVPEFLNVSRASAACYSGAEAEVQLRRRLSQLLIVAESNLPLNHFLSSRFIPAMEQAISKARANWPAHSGFDQILDQLQLTLSPSDFGFHNMLKKKDGALYFLDFEYFGWDDPVKLITDMSFHPGMTLTYEELEYLIKGSKSIFGQFFFDRLKVLWPIYALIWCLILLNEFRSEIMHRRLLSNAARHEDQEEYKVGQLDKANKLLDKIQINNFGFLLSTI